MDLCCAFDPLRLLPALPSFPLRLIQVSSSRRRMTRPVTWSRETASQARIDRRAGRPVGRPAHACLAGAPGTWPCGFFPRARAPFGNPGWNVSRVLSVLADRRIIHLGDALLRRSSALPGHRARRTGHLDGPSWLRCPYLSLLREGLAAPPVTRPSRVGSYPTISPLPVPPPRAPLEARGLNGHRRSAFCCAFPRVAPGRR